MSLPKLINFVWGGGEMPAWARRNIEEFRRLNPDYEIRIHGPDVVLPELQGAFDQAQGWSSKSDPMRYSALKRYGGWYFDVDFWPLRPLDHALMAWGIDGRRMFISKQQGHKAGDRLPLNAAACAADRDSPGLALLIAACAIKPADSRIAYGPELLRDVVAEHPDQFLVSEAGWWYPVSIDQALAAYPLLMSDPDRLALRNGKTGGVLPFGAHLWAEAHDLATAFAHAGENRPLAYVQSAPAGENIPLNAIVKGLEACGYQVTRAEDPSAIERGIIRPAVVVVWNGVRDPGWKQAAETMGCPMLFVEHGFFQRKHFSQVDHRGNLHRSSWRGALTQPAPDGSDERLALFYPDGLQPMKPRTGYVLALGQVSGDTQLIESEIQGAAQLERYLSANLPAGTAAYMRPHPLIPEMPRSRVHRSLARLPQSDTERQSYVSKKHGSGMASALSGAQFVVAINSNGLNEALAAGIPCLAFGPFLGIDAGVVHPTSLATLKRDLNAMLRGWMPDSAKVENYLRHLAAHQWSNAELATPNVLAPLLLAAGVQPTLAAAAAQVAA